MLNHKFLLLMIRSMDIDLSFNKVLMSLKSARERAGELTEFEKGTVVCPFANWPRIIMTSSRLVGSGVITHTHRNSTANTSF